MAVYVDGQPVTVSFSNKPTTALATNCASALNTNFIGASFVNGVDNYRIYSRALSAADVTALYNAEKNIVLLSDTTAPVISGVSFSPTSGWRKIGDTVTITINSDGTGYTAGTITVNGKNITGFASAGGNNYQATYTIASGDTDRADTATIPVSIVLKDAANNLALHIQHLRQLPIHPQ